MRKLLALCAIAAAAVLVPADVSAAPVEATLSGSVTQGGAWCCGQWAMIEGVGTVSAVGRVSFVADWLSGYDRPEIGVPNRCFTTVELVLTAMNGDTLTLSGGSDSANPLAIPWSVVGGTGRFASASGSGTFNFSLDFPAPPPTIVLTGTLSR